MRFLILFALVFAAVMISPVPASAHAILTSSTPKNNAILSTPPKNVTLSFEARIEKRVAQVALSKGSQKIALKAPTGGYANGLQNQLVIPVPPLKPGKYTLQYRIMATDGHLTPGRIQFTIAKGKPK